LAATKSCAYHARRPDEDEEQNVKTRTSKAIGVAVSAAAIAVSGPFAVTAQAEPTTTPVAEIPDPQGPDCGDFKDAMPNWKSLAKLPVGAALAAIPDLSMFNAAISGEVNPAVNIVPVLDNGPYVVFAPTNKAFSELPPGQLELLRSDPAALTSLMYYHVFLGLLGPDDVKGQRTTQQGTEIEVTGSGGDVAVNETAKVICGGIQAKNARIYVIDQVLNPADAPAPIAPAPTSASTETETATPATTTTAPAESPSPAPDAPIG
jgi:uncharacterized surface protein with fasciclin (FAS1) repeats